MGIMQNKVTRRIALGSLATGLGGAALVIRALKGRYNVIVPDSSRKYAAEWESNVKLIDVPIKMIGTPSRSTIAYTPEIGENFRVVSLDASYGKGSYPAAYPQPPFWYTITDGQASVISPIDSATIAIHISVNHYVTKLGTREIEGPACKFIVGLVNGQLHYFEPDSTIVKKLPRSRVTPACIALGAALVFYYPKKNVLAKGMKWTIPAASHHGIELPCEVVGFAEIAGGEAAVIKAERHLSNQEYQRDIAGQMKRARENEQKRGSSSHVSQTLAKSLQEIIKEECTQAFQFTWYVDLKSGITVRRELVATIHRPKQLNSDTIDITTSQIVKT
jgi:hypothetical protein